MFSKFSEEAQKVLIMAKKEMSDLKHPYVGTEHLLLAILRSKNEVSDRFRMYGVTYQSFRNELIKVIGVGNDCNNWFLYTTLLKRILDSASMYAKEVASSEVTINHMVIAMIEEADGIAIRILSTMDVDLDKLYDEFSTKIVDKKDKFKRRLLIEDFGIDLTKKALKGGVDPVIGRDEEIDKLIQILCRRNKNNPLLIGEAGVGKTSIVEELSRRIINDEVPLPLKGKRVISVFVSSLVAGTKYRGEFEERINKVLKEIEGRDDIILFIDEVHTLVGAGGADGAIDASNILKPSLARGAIKLIGATTVDEYKKTIEKDKALDRRFQKIEVLEPSKEKTYAILLGLKDLYASFHGVKIEDELLKYIIDLTDKYMYDRYQPDKSLDILDEVCSRVNLNRKSDITKLDNLKIEINKLKKCKNECISSKNFDGALCYRNKIVKLEDKLNRELLKERNSDYVKISKNDIKQVVFNKTKIPIYDIDDKCMAVLNDIEPKLNKIIKGQENAIKCLAECTKRIKLGFKDSRRPASFLFVGSTGIGKTCLVKEYAKLLGNHLIRLDMSEYREGHSTSKILGSPAGYVGYDDGKNILEEIRQNPYSIILLDEIEKANRSVINLFLQILDEGFIKDATGKIIRFDNTVIIMTSNVGFGKENLGFNECRGSIDSKLKEYFSVEFLNRIDKTIIFNKLTGDNVRDIIKQKIKDLKKVFLEKGLKINISNKVIDEILEMCEYDIYGARRIDKILDDKVNSIIIKMLTEGQENVSVGTILV